MRIPEKSLSLIRSLQEKITSGQLSPGTRLPAIRDLMEQFNLSYGSVQRGIDFLVERGYVESFTGRGTFVRDNYRSSSVSPGQVRIAVILKSMNHLATVGIYPTVWLGIQEAAGNHECSLLLSYLKPIGVHRDMLQKTLQDADGAIFLCEQEDVIDDPYLGKPVVGVSQHQIHGLVSVVDIDPLQSAFSASDYFQGTGRNRIIIIMTDDPVYRNRAEQFRLEWTRRGGNADICLHPVDLCFAPENGYLFTTGSLLQHYSLLHEQTFGSPLAHEHIVLGIDGKNRIDPDFHAAPSIAIDWMLAGRYALEECLYRIRHPGSLPRRIYLPGQLTVPSIQTMIPNTQ